MMEELMLILFAISLPPGGFNSESFYPLDPVLDSVKGRTIFTLDSVSPTKTLEIKPEFNVIGKYQLKFSSELSDIALSTDGDLMGLLFFGGDLWIYDLGDSVSFANGLNHSPSLTALIDRGCNILSINNTRNFYMAAAGGSWGLFYLNKIVRDRAGGIGWVKDDGIYFLQSPTTLSPEILSLDISPGNVYVATGMSDNSVLIYRIFLTPYGTDTVKLEKSFIMQAPVVAVKFLSDSVLAVADRDGEINVLSLNSMSHLADFSVPNGVNSIEAVDKSGVKYLLVTDGSGKLRIFDVNNRRLFYQKEFYSPDSVPVDIYVSISTDTSIFAVFDRTHGLVKFYSLQIPYTQPEQLFSYQYECTSCLLNDVEITPLSGGNYRVFLGAVSSEYKPGRSIVESYLQVLDIRRGFKILPVSELATTQSLKAPSPDYFANKRFHYIVMGSNGNELSNGYPPLRYAERDAIAVSQLLNKEAAAGYASFDGVALIGPDFISDSAKVIIHQVLLSADSNDVVFIYVATHGHYDPLRNENYLLTYDTYWQDSVYYDDIYNQEINTISNITTQTSISYEWLANEIEKSKAGLIILIIDACYSGTEDDIEDLVAYRNDGGMIFKKISREKPNSRIFLFSSYKNQPSIEDDSLGHGVFTYFLLMGLGGAADSDNDNIVTIRELWKYVVQSVNKYFQDRFGRSSHVIPQHPFSLGNVRSDQPILLIVR